MRGVKRTIPLFIICAREACGAIHEVRSPADQRMRKYCSRRCASIVNQNIRKGIARGVAGSVRARKLALVERVKDLTPLEAFKIGYKRGLYSKLTQVRRRYLLTKRSA